MALAYLITFTTYGARLHGSAKGSVDDEHNAYGTPFVVPDSERERRAHKIMTEPAYSMGPVERDILCKAIVDLATERGWLLLAAHVRSNHVHVVISAEHTPERIMSDLKARASRDLSRAGFGNAECRRWTRHGSTRHLFEEEHVEAAVHYALDEQGERMASQRAAHEVSGELSSALCCDAGSIGTRSNKIKTPLTSCAAL
jgi:REP element-mobilizing transposase RayT